MARQSMTTDEILAEIEVLKKSPYVKIAKDAENRMLRQKLYQLRSLDKKGREIAKVSGIEVQENG